MRLDLCQLWDGKSELYVTGHPVRVKAIGSVTLPGSVDIYEDRRFTRGCDVYGRTYLLYWGPEGFQNIIIQLVELK